MTQELRPVTILFADVKDYTTLSEQVDVEVVTEVLVPFLNRLAAVVQYYGGRVVYSAGDNIMATFGASSAHEDDPVRAVRSALAMLQAVDEMAPFCEQRLGRRLSLRVGVNTGMVMAGAVGLGAAENVRGDAVNVAARLESAAEPGTVLVGQGTHSQATWAFRWGEPKQLQVKGREEPVECFEAQEAISDLARPRGISNLPTPFVGRERELSALVNAWESARNNSPRIVSLIGDAGVGKSRLIAEFELALRGEAEGRIVRGLTPPIGNQPFGPIIGALQALAGESAGEEAGTPGDLLQLLKAEGDLPTNKEALHWQIASLLQAEARRTPSILVLEDLHWADSATWEAVAFLCEHLQNAPLLILLTYRAADDAVPLNPKRHSAFQLNPLADDETRHLTELMFGSADIPPELRRALVAQAEGNPFYMEEIIRTLVEQGTLVYQDGGWVCTKTPDELALPDSLRTIVLARLDQLEGNLRGLVRTSAVVGRTFLNRVLLEVSEDGGEVPDELQRLVDTGLVRPSVSSPDGPLHSFDHVVIRDVAYDTVPQRQRAQLHLRVANALERLFSDRLQRFAESLAYHYEEGGDSERAARHYLVASERAEQVHADREAHKYREAARRLLGMTSVWSMYAGSERISPGVRIGAWAFQLALAVVFSLPLLALFMSQRPSPDQITLGVPLDIISVSPSVMTLAALIGALPLLLTSLGLNQVAVPALLKGNVTWGQRIFHVAVAWLASLAAVLLVLVVLGVALRFGWLNQTLENFMGAAALQLLRGDMALIATILLGTLIPAIAWMAWLSVETARWQERLASDAATAEAGNASVIQGLARFVAIAALMSLALLLLYVSDILPGTTYQPDPDVALFLLTGVLFAVLGIAGLGVFVWLRRSAPEGGAGTLGLELPLVLSLMFGVVLAFTLRQDVVTIANGLYGPGELAGFERATTLFPDLATAHYLKGERLWFGVTAVIDGGELVYDPDELQEVHDAFSRAIEADPSFAPAYFGRGSTRLDLGNPEGTADDAARLIELQPDHPAGYAMLAKAELQLGNNEEAIEALTKAVEPLPEDTRAWDAFWARCLALDGASGVDAPIDGIPRDAAARVDAAIADCEESLDLNDQHAPTFDELGYLYFSVGRYEDALRVYDEYAEIAPEPRALVNRAIALMYLGRYEEALPDLDRAIELLPDYAKAFRLRAETYLYLDDGDTAFADAEHARDLQPDSFDSYIVMAVVSLYTGRTEQAIEAADQLEALGLDESVVRNVRGYAFALAGDHERALEELDRAVELQPASASALDSRSYARYLAGENDDALADVEQALALVEPYNRLSRSEYLYHRALIRAALGDAAGAEEDAVEAQGLTPVPLVARGLQELLTELQAQ